MSDAMDVAPDIAILLAHSWQNHRDQPIDREIVCRVWAFDMGWFDMETSTRVRDNLIKSGWIDETPDGLMPAIDVADILVPFGWLPTMRLLESPPTLPKGSSATVKVSAPAKKSVKVESTVESVPIDPAASHITDLLDQIANSSGLDRKEVMRRAQRKRRALGPVTLWMTLLLVAREQQLPMKPFMRAIAG
ncbi:MAG: DUF2240 family protein [Candidatus Poseidoniales archaeon]